MPGACKWLAVQCVGVLFFAFIVLVSFSTSTQPGGGFKVHTAYVCAAVVQGPQRVTCMCPRTARCCGRAPRTGEYTPPRPCRCPGRRLQLCLVGEGELSWVCVGCLCCPPGPDRETMYACCMLPEECSCLQGRKGSPGMCVCLGCGKQLQLSCGAGGWRAKACGANAMGRCSCAPHPYWRLWVS
jgi:hypothetical protein